MRKIQDDSRIINVGYEDEMKQSFIDYSMSVIVQRALPDVRDGLKPVHRRILNTMYEEGYTPDKEYKKCATTVGTVLGRYHPHGDSSVYESMVRLAQDFKMQIPLIDGHGNFGSVDGDSAAAYRYTESRLSKLSMEMLSDIDKNIVDTEDNFDGTVQEPTVLPSKFPNLLVNGASGIAVGMTTEIPPHNLGDTVKAVTEYINNPDISIDKLAKFLKGPDFPTGGIISNKDELIKIYEEGTGKIKIRAKITVENTKNGKTNLIINEVPYTWSGCKTNNIEKIIDMIIEGKFNEISDLRDESSSRDESSKTGVRIVIEVKKGIDIDKLINKLYKRTLLEDTITVFLRAIVNKRPELLNLKQIIEHYVNHQKAINIRKYNYLLDKDKKREEILVGMIKAHNVLKSIVEVILGSENKEMARKCLITGNIEGITFESKKAEKDAKLFNFTTNQTEFILDRKLGSLTGLEILALKDELSKIVKNIEYYKNILTDEKILLGIIKDYLVEIKNTYSVKRRTEIDSLETVEIIDEFIEENLTVLIDKFGYVKTIDIAGFNKANEDAIKDYKYIFNSSNTDRLNVFTEMGNMYQLKVKDIPKGKLKDKGIPLDSTLKMGKNENVILIDTFNAFKNKKLFFTTQKGMVKITQGIEFESVRTLTNYTKLDNDKVINIYIIDESNIPTHQVLVSNNGFALKYDFSKVAELRKNSKGVKSMILSSDDYVENVYFITNKESFIINVNSKDVDISKMKTKKRNHIGVKI